jgi:hypothetical protein
MTIWNLRKTGGRGRFTTGLFPAAAWMLVCVAGAEAQGQTCVDDTAGPFGSLLNKEEFDSAVQALPPAAFHIPPVEHRLPARVFLSNLPAVAQQGTTAQPGSPGTCEAQSFGYGLGSYTAAREPDGSPKWNPALPQNSVSSAYLFSWALNYGSANCPTGSGALQYPAHLVAVGSPTRALVPYQPSCPYFEETIPGQADFPDSYPDMKRFRIGSYAAFTISNNPSALQLIKEFIANGQAVAFSGWVLCGYGNNVQLQDGVIYETAHIIKSDGTPAGHGQLVVGYDDDIGVPGNKGALLIQNSFGTAWPASAGATHSPAPPGMAFWSYNSFEQTQQLAAVAHPRSSGPPAEFRLSASLHAPSASVTRAFQWVPANSPQSGYLIVTLFFHDPIFLDKIDLTEPGSKGITAVASYGQYISTGYSYISSNDGNAFLPGPWAVTLEGSDISGNPITYTGTVWIGRPLAPGANGVSMAGRTITGPTGAAAAIGP